VFVNFLRFKPEYKCLFQYHHLRTGASHYIPLEKLFEYEHSSRAGMNEETRSKLLAEVDPEEFHYDPIPGKITLNDVEEFLKNHLNSDLKMLEEIFAREFPTEHTDCVKRMFSDIGSFILTEPRLPSVERSFRKVIHPRISVTDSRDEIIGKITDLSTESEMALLALYAFRDMERTDWRPFIKAAIERNPVSHDALAGRSADEIYHIINKLKNKSIYDSGRMAQPDEVWNFRRGDGAEKAFLMANVLLFNDPGAEVAISLHDDHAILEHEGQHFSFVTAKGHNKKILIGKGSFIAE